MCLFGSTEQCMLSLELTTQVFKVFDGDGSGRLDREELDHALVLTGTHAL
jgi:Ca2+-binding EF-hand superfamily protein